MSHRFSKFSVSAFLLLTANHVRANVYFPSDATIDSFLGTGGNTYSIVVGYDNDTDYMNRTNGTSPTVTLVDGAYLPDEIFAANGSTIDVEGGYADAIGANDSANIDLNGGDVSTMGVGGTATINIAGGTMDYGPFTLDSSTLIMSGGEVGTAKNSEANVSIEDQSTALLDGGTIDSSLGVSGQGQVLADMMTIVGGVQLSNASTFTMSGGTIGSLTIYDNSTATVTDGTIVGLMASYSGETSTASGTTIGGGYSFGGTINLNGCTDTGGIDSEKGVINVSGGSIAGNATSYTNSASAPAIQIRLDDGVSVTGIVAAYNVGAIAIFDATVAGDVEAHQHGAIGMSDGTLNGGVNTYDNGAFILDGGTVNGDLYAYDSSTITINGGNITGTLYDSSNQYHFNTGITITGGTIANLEATDYRYVTMSGGTILNNLTARTDSSFTLTGGSVNGTATGYNFSAIHIDGATVTNIVAHDYSNFDLISGTINGSIQVHDFGAVNMSGGSVYGSLMEDSYGEANLSGGRIGNDAALSNQSSLDISDAGDIGGNVTAHDFSDIHMSGGTIAGNVDFYNNSGFYWSGGHIQGIISMHDDSFLQWTGGTFGAGNTGSNIGPADSPANTSTPIYVYDNATLEIDGIHLTSTLVNADANGFSLYSLSGNIGDGSTISPDLQLYIQNPTATTAGGSLQLDHAQQQWITATGGSWATSANWLANLVPDEAGASVNFTDTSYVENPTDNHVTLDGNYTLGSLTFATANNIILDPGTAGTIILNNEGSNTIISVTTAHPQINVPVILQSDTTILVGENDDDVRTARSLAIEPSDYYYYVTLTLNSGLTIPTGITVTKDGYYPLYTTFVRGSNLDIEEGSVQILPNGTPTGTSRIGGLNIAYAALDLANNDLILDYTAGNSPLELIQDYLCTGYDYGYWDGIGINSSTASDNPNVSTTLGYADNNDLGLTTFDGQSVGPNVILIKYTWIGDANLDGVVNDDDLSMMSPSGTTWSKGDFNYDRVVNGDDYALFMLGAAEGSQNISTTLPEPSAAILLLTPLLLVRGRSRSS